MNQHSPLASLHPLPAIAPRRLPRCFWVVITDFGLPLGFASKDLCTMFDDAVGQFIEHRDEDRPAQVIEVDLTVGTSEDVSADAIARARTWWAKNGAETPEWAA